MTSDRARIATTGEEPNEPKDDKAQLKMPFDFVVARGGEYFFVPSMSTLDKLVEGEELPASDKPIVLKALIPGINFPPPRPAEGAAAGAAGPGGPAVSLPTTA